MADPRTLAFKLLATMATDNEFIRFLEHLESSRGNRPLHQLAENTNALFEAYTSLKNLNLRGSTNAAVLTFSGTQLTLSGADALVGFPAVLGDGTTVATTNTLTNALIAAAIATLSGAQLAADCWLVLGLDRDGTTPTVKAYQTSSAYITAMQGAAAASLDHYPLAYSNGTHCFIFPAKVWLGTGESLRNGLRDYVTQLDVDRLDDVQAQNVNTFMTGGLNAGDPVEFSWDAGTGQLTWDATWYVKGRVSVDSSDYGPFNNTVAAGNITIAAQGDVAYIALDRSNATPARTAQTATTVPNGSMKDAFVFAVWGEDDRLYLADGTVIDDGGTSTLGGTPAGVRWFFSGTWDGTTASMPFATDTSGGRNVSLAGSPVSPAVYTYGGHHIMVYVNGKLAKGSASGSLANGDRYREIDDGGGVGTTIQWLSDPTGASTPGNVPINIPGANDFIEVFLPSGSGIGAAGRWQTIQLLELSSTQNENPGGGAVASFSGTVTKAPTGSAPDTEWHGLADHTGARMVVTHDDGAGGDVQTSTADGDGTFTSTAGVDDTDAATTYDPLTGTLSLVFNAGNRRVTDIEYVYITAPEDEEHRVEGVQSPTSMLPILLLGGMVGESYYHDHPGDDRTTLVLDATVASGVSSIGGMTGAIALVNGSGILLQVNTPSPGSLTVGVDTTVPQVTAGRAADTGAALDQAHSASAGAPASGNPYVAVNSTLVGADANDKAGFQGVLTASPNLDAKKPLLAVEMLRETLRTTGADVFARPTAADDLVTDTVRLEKGASVVLPQVDGSRNFDIRPVKASAVIASPLSGRTSGAALSASGGEWLWVYAKELVPDPGAAFRGSTSSADFLHYSKSGPAQLDELAVDHGRMVHPDFSVVGGGSRRGAVPLACLLTGSATQVLTNQSFDYESGYLALRSQEVFDRTSASLTATTRLAPGGTGYQGLNGDPTVPLLPLNAAGKATYVRMARFRVRAERQATTGFGFVRFQVGNYVTQATAFTLAQTAFAVGGLQAEEHYVDVPLPVSDDFSGAVDHGDIDLYYAMTDLRIRVFLEGLHFRPGFWSNS